MKRKYVLDQVFVVNSPVSQCGIRSYYKSLSDVPYVCRRCGQCDWQGERLNLELDHINGDRRDNRLTNLRWLCPNCHSLTPTYKNGGRGLGKKIVSDEKLIEAMRSSRSISESLQKVGLAPRGGNYVRVKKLSVLHGIDFYIRTNLFCPDCKVAALSQGAERCVECNALKQRKVQRPSRDNLARMMNELPWTRIAERYGVSDKSVVKWAKAYDLPIPSRRPRMLTRT